jgi:exosortase
MEPTAVESTDTADPDRVSLTRRQQIPRAGLVILCAHLPFFSLHLLNLWRYRPHYEFFPLVLAVGGWLIWQRWPRGEVRHTRATRSLGAVLLVVGGLALTGSVALFSPWLAAIATLFSLGGILLRTGGQSALRELAGPWLLLWLIVPPPLRLDDELIRVLQGVTARATSGLLDLMHIEHLLTGHVFRLPGRELFVAEACSGVHSQLVLIAVSIVLAVYWRRTFLHSVLLAAASVFCAATVNTARVLLIVLAAAKWDMDLSSGWQHEVLGYSLVVAGLLLLLSADQFLQGVLAPIVAFWRPEPIPEGELRPGASDPLSRFWNWLIARYQTRPRGLDHTPDGADEVNGRPGAWRGVAAAVPFACLAGLQIFLLAADRTPALRLEPTALGIQEDWLPERLEAWERKAFAFEEREVTSDEGRYSSIWDFESAGRKARISVDYPFVGWHELTRCYRALGWQEVSREVRTGDESIGAYVAVRLRAPGDQHGYLLFSVFDGALCPVTPRISHWRGLRGKLVDSPLAILLGFGEGSVSSSSTTLQVQQFITGNATRDPSQREAANRMYLDFRQRLVERLRAETEGK